MAKFETFPFPIDTIKSALYEFLVDQSLRSNLKSEIDHGKTLYNILRKQYLFEIRHFKNFLYENRYEYFTVHELKPILKSLGVRIKFIKDENNKLFRVAYIDYNNLLLIVNSQPIANI